MDIYKIVGHNIRSLRNSIEPSVSINRLAAAAEIDPGQLSRAERGLVGLSLPALARIAETLSVPVVRLIDQQAESISESGQAYSYSRKNDRASLISELTDLILKSTLNEHKNTITGNSEKKLLRHQIQAAIEEGITRGQIKVEGELAHWAKEAAE
ncbi:MAG: helix-turn-helix transcriptional regulator [Mariprofundaceae bacterium]